MHTDIIAEVASDYEGLMAKYEEWSCEVGNLEFKKGGGGLRPPTKDQHKK